jgi:predicted ATPase/DNA-binding winged helix-turn-helix (wHTH) protein
MPNAPLLFDRFELQPAQRRLLRDGVPVPLRARAFDLLQVLAERPGSLVTKAELLDLVWSGLVVEENNIAAQIAALRKVLGSELIATIPGRGYRFAAETRPASTGPEGAGTAGVAPATASAAPAGSAAVIPPAPAAAAATPTAAQVVAAAPVGRGGPLLFGRDHDRESLEAALGRGGCVSLVGPGGVGKTVLAKAVLAARGPAASAWVDLAELSDGTQLDGALARALHIAVSASPTEWRQALATALGSGPFLLVLDNAEHLIEAVAALVPRLLEAAPSLALLVTSQLPLRVAIETVQSLAPLTAPAEGLSDDEALLTASVQMLMDRVRAADPRFALPRETWPALRQLCVRLDGLPLALEMAAPMVPLLGWQGVLSALDERLAAFRRGPRGAVLRHKTLLAAMSWSHSLLPAPAQRVFRRLGVFASGFSLDLAAAVAGDEGEDRWEVIDTLAELVERSLVTSLHEDPPRYRLLETMRSFALQQLDASGERDAVQGRAVSALAACMARSAPGTADPVAVSELGNVPEALAWARRHDPAAAVELTLGASAVATWTPWLSEAAGWIGACEPLLDDGIAPDRQAAWWRELARFQSFVRGPRTVEAAQKACALERAHGNASGLFWSLIPLLRSRVLEADAFEAVRAEAQALLDAHPDWPARQRVIFSGSLAMEYRRRGDFEAAWRHQQDEADLAERAGLHQIAANAQSNLTATLVGLGRFEQALERLDALLARQGDAPSAVNAHNRVQRLNALIGLRRFDEAQAHARDALDWCRRYDVLDIFQVVALLAAGQGRAAVAALYLGHHRACLAERGAELPTDTHAPWREALRQTADTLPEARLQGLMARGATLAPEAIDRLLFEDDATV